MNRNKYFDYIEEKLNTLSTRIETKGKMNLFDIHNHSENFYVHFFNLVYGYELVNLNIKHQNVEAIDLIDDKNKILIQVSATSTKQKIESALSKDIMKKYNGYTFKFISISKHASDLRQKNYANPYQINFTPAQDIYDKVKILNEIRIKNIDEIKAIYEYIKKELGEDVDIVKLDSNLATIINILSEEQWDEANQTNIENIFEIERKITFNELKNARDTIKEYCVYYRKVDEKYTEFDNRGVNKSNSVLASIKREYLKFKDKDADSIFLSVIDSVKNKVLNSSNFEQIPIDELELCVDILVVDAFVRCKIFENPEEYNYATS
ncbi:MAG: hypothetical protein CVT88_00370 [Candidatus Altiarchaeales archaeon HGW-Altiarchaeales-1]|nr:MAG: hypothetical protein CVT88_00370 [Candidatus Altiarchaeales archaeon HGW-Altiarchaeales-1]